MTARLVLPLLALAAAAHDPLAGRVPGPASDCIDLDRVQGPDIQDGAILYAQNHHRIWRAEPIGTCPGLDRFARLTVVVQGRELCRDDRFRPVPLGGLPGALCRFGSFVPYDLPRR